MRTTDFLRLAAAPEPRQAAEQALSRYGCGTCGPRGFYGTLDVHLELAAGELAQWQADLGQAELLRSADKEVKAAVVRL